MDAIQSMIDAFVENAPVENVGGDSEHPKPLLSDPPWLHGLSNRRIGMPCLVCEEAPDGKLVKLHF